MWINDQLTNRNISNVQLMYSTVWQVWKLFNYTQIEIWAKIAI